MGNNDSNIYRCGTKMTLVQDVIIARHENSGLMQNAVADLFGICDSSLSRLLNKKRIIYADELLKFMVLYGISPSELMSADLLAEYERNLKRHKHMSRWSS